MAVERASAGTSLIDVLDRVLDKGIVIDAWVRVSLVGIDLITVEARVVVASIETYLKYSEAVGQIAPISRPNRSVPSSPGDDENDDDDDDGSGGASGAPALQDAPIRPRKRIPSRPHRTITRGR
jgi:gas vesicle structural protein